MYQLSFIITLPWLRGNITLLPWLRGNITLFVLEIFFIGFNHFRREHLISIREKSKGRDCDVYNVDEHSHGLENTIAEYYIY